MIQIKSGGCRLTIKLALHCEILSSKYSLIPSLHCQHYMHTEKKKKQPIFFPIRKKVGSGVWERGYTKYTIQKCTYVYCAEDVSRVL